MTGTEHEEVGIGNQPPVIIASQSELPSVAREKLEEALADAPEFRFAEGRTQEEFDVEAAEGAKKSFYGPEGTAGIMQDAVSLSRLINKEIQAGREQAGSELLSKERLRELERLIGDDVHSGASLTAVRLVAYKYGENVAMVYNNLYPPKRQPMSRRLGSVAYRVKQWFNNY